MPLSRCCRRALLPAFAFVLATSLTLAATSAQAADAQQTLQTAVDKILVVLRNPDFKSGPSQQALETQLRGLVRDIFDFSELTRLSLGVHWKRFSPAEQAQAADAMADLLEATYIGSLKKYDNQQVQYGDVVSGERGAVEIRTTVVSGSNTIPIAYRMRDLNGWKVYDVVIEGVSLVKNYRTQFQELMVNGTPQDLIAKIKERAAASRSAS
ncbi:Tgt2/MlaC family protein [Megalodesulfovibrio paquesii]